MPKSFIFILFLLASCGQNNAGKDQTLTTDKSAIATANWPTLKEVRQNYVLTYDKPVEFSGIDEGKPSEEIKVWGKYYCLFDNAVDIPGKYLLDDKEKSFTTHNFAEDLVVVSNNDTIIKKTITKRDFAEDISSDLVKYGVIGAPTFCGYDDKTDAFTFYFNISIPVTGIAISKKLSIQRNGELRITDK